MEFHHIGIACNNIEEELNSIKRIHTIKSISEIIFDKEQNANLCMVEVENNLKLELISGEVVKNILKKNINYYHICYQCDHIESQLNFLLTIGGIQLNELKPAILFQNKKVVFLKMSYGIIELLEK
jgi:methylmalonyl-CoA/ethylmalonyl-CoA epimerase